MDDSTPVISLPGSAGSSAAGLGGSRPRPSRVIAAILALSAVIACSNPLADPQAGSKVADVWVTIGNVDDQGILFSIAGGVAAFNAAPGFQRFLQRDPAHSALVVVAPSSLGAGEVRVGAITAREGTSVTDLKMTVIEVASADFDIRADVTGYSVRLAAH